MAFNCNYQFKYIIVGDSSVGKSNLLSKFAHGKFTEDYQATIGVEFGVKNIEINNQIYRVQMWDTAGQEAFHSIIKDYYKKSVCAMVVYDITNHVSFEHVQNWIEDIHNQCPKTVLIILVGNKIDLEDKREIPYDEGKEFAKKNGFIFGETSTKTGVGVEEIVVESINEIIKKINDNYYDLSSEDCGIKKRNINSSYNLKTGNIDLNNNNNSNNNKIGERKKCCY